VNPTSQILLPELAELIANREFRALRESLKGVPAADVADLLADLPLEEAAVCFRLLPRDGAGAVFADLEGDLQQALIEQLGDIRSRQAIEALDPDDRARVLDELPTQVAKRLILSLSPATRRETQAILGYPSDAVGRIMTPDYVRVRPDWTVAKAFEHIRRFGRDAETVHWIFIIDEDYRLIDDIHIRQLLLADPDALISSIMDDAFLALNADEDREEAVRMMGRYDRTALPVIDSRGVLMGIVTHDDVADVAEEEVTEDIQKQAGMEALAKPYMQTGLAEMIKKRGGWLCALLLLQVATIGVLDMFQSQLAEAAILISFIPLIISSGGNTGTQAASLLIRAISLDEIEHKEWSTIIVRELRTGIILGLVLGVVSFLVVVGLDAAGIAEDTRAFSVGLTVGISILAIVIWGVTLGSMFPILLDRMGLDPATISSPLVATLMDVSGIVIYLLIASVLVL